MVAAEVTSSQPYSGKFQLAKVKLYDSVGVR